MCSFQGPFLVVSFDSSFSASSRAEFSTSAQADPVFEFSRRAPQLSPSLFVIVSQSSVPWPDAKWYVAWELGWLQPFLWWWTCPFCAYWSGQLDFLEVSLSGVQKKFFSLCSICWKSPLKSVELFSDANVEVTRRWPTASCETFPLALLVYF